VDWGRRSDAEVVVGAGGEGAGLPEREPDRRLLAAGVAVVVAVVVVTVVAVVVALGRDDEDGGAAVRVGSAPATSTTVPADPRVDLEAATGLVDGERVRMAASGLVPGSSLSWELCDGALARCGGAGHTTDVADRDGRLVTDAPLWRMVGVRGAEPGAGGTLDCAADPCRLRFHGETPDGSELEAAAGSFDPDHGERRPPTATLADAGPSGPGDRVRIDVVGVEPGVVVDAILCHPDGGGECVGAGGEADGRGVVAIELVLPEVPTQWRAGCERCPVVFDGYRREDPGGLPPLLHAEPLELAVAG